jgi:hypothetical protein
MMKLQRRRQPGKQTTNHSTPLATSQSGHAWIPHADALNGALQNAY